MKERPILFNGPMVRAILDGSKTQTRRVMKPQPEPTPADYPGPAGHWWPCNTVQSMAHVEQELRNDSKQWSGFAADCCPHGGVGDRLWVRESYRFPDGFDIDSPARVAERCLDAGYSKPWAPIQYDADGARRDWRDVSTPRQVHVGGPNPGKGRPSIHMPRWASRILLEIVSVHVERLRDIKEADARAEGVTIEDHHMRGYCAGEFLPPSIRAYRDLWESINGASSWDANPWVWVIQFKRVTP